MANQDLDLGIIYGSTTGRSARIADRLLHAFGQGQAYDIAQLAHWPKHRYLILGMPTWDTGQPQEDWAPRLNELGVQNWQDRQVACYGLGDAVGYPDSFADALGLLVDQVAATGARVSGFTDTSGYRFRRSRACRAGRFCGLVLDEETQADRSMERLTAWVRQLRREWGPCS